MATLRWQMLELSDRDFKEFIKKLFGICLKIWKIESLSQEIGYEKKNQMEILQLKYNNWKKKRKSQWLGSAAEWRGKRKESVNWKREQSKLPNMSNPEKIDWGKMNSASGNCGPRTKDPTFTSLESRMEKRKRGAEEMLEEIMAENIQNLAKDINLQGQKAEWILNRKNLKKSTAVQITVKFLKTNY